MDLISIFSLLLLRSWADNGFRTAPMRSLTSFSPEVSRLESSRRLWWILMRELMVWIDSGV